MVLDTRMEIILVAVGLMVLAIPLPHQHAGPLIPQSRPA
jgi:hypothetical protein